MRPSRTNWITAQILPLQPWCAHVQSISGVFSMASHWVLQYLPDVVTHEQRGVRTSHLLQSSFLFSASEQQRIVGRNLCPIRNTFPCTRSGSFVSFGTASVARACLSFEKVDRMDEGTFDIFSGAPEEHGLWVEAVEGLSNARQRMGQIAAAEHGKYFLFSRSSQSILARMNGDSRAFERPYGLHGAAL